MTELTSLSPKSVDFELCGLPLTYRPYSIADDIKAQEICGGQKELIAAFQNSDFEKLSLVAWYQLDIDSQKTILNHTEGVFVDPETGVETKSNTTPLQRFRALFVGVGDQISLITNLMNCKGLNIPDIKNPEALGKWVSQMAVALRSTGLKSSI